MWYRYKLDKLIKFHIDHNYYVKIKPLPRMIGCVVEFPKNIIKKLPEINRSYIINDKLIDIFHVETGKDIDTKSVSISKFGIRLLIMEDILIRTIQRQISRKLIFVENRIKDSIFDVLKIDMNKDELILEKELCLIFRGLLAGKVDYEVKKEIEESYRVLFNCFESGGL
jgi:hypothetical protein